MKSIQRYLEFRAIIFRKKGDRMAVLRWRPEAGRARERAETCWRTVKNDHVGASLCVAQVAAQEGASLVDTVVVPSCLLHSSLFKNTHNICTNRQSCKMLDKYSQYFLSHQLDPLLLPDPQDPVDTTFNFLLSIILDLQREGWVFSLMPHWSLQSMNFNC